MTVSVLFLKLYVFSKEFLSPLSTPKLQCHPLSENYDCLFRILAPTLHFWKASPTSVTWGHIMPWSQIPTYHEQMNNNTENCSECGHVAVVNH